MKPTSATYALRSLQGQPSGTHFLVLLVKIVREYAYLISLGILFHIFNSNICHGLNPKMRRIDV